MNIRIPLLILLLSFLSSGLYAQKRYWLPADLTSTAVRKTPIFCSKWLGVCSYQLTEDEYDELGRPAPVETYAPLRQRSEAEGLGFALEQIEGQLLIERDITARDIKIGIIDGGFLGADTDPSLGQFFQKKQVRWYKDFINPLAEDFGGFKGLDDNHGTEVWGLIGGINRETKVQFGLATEAEYYLARTDHGSYEKRIEEDFLIAALEAMDSMGVRLVNISLGYSTGYSDETENYAPEDMDGTSMMAQAIDHAFEQENMLVVVAAGNEGHIPDWRVVSTPGDAAGALSVGAAKFKVWDKMGYSSIGPESLPYVKPNVSVYAASGTSYSAPVITGLAACLMQLQPEISAKEMRDLIERSSHLYPYANNYLGYGVPRISHILSLLEGKEPDRPTLLKVRKRSLKFRGDIEGKVVVVYHKKDERNVLSRRFLRPEKGVIKIQRAEGAAFTTVLVEQRATEIEWLD